MAILMECQFHNAGNKYKGEIHKEQVRRHNFYIKIQFVKKHEEEGENFQKVTVKSMERYTASNLFVPSFCLMKVQVCKYPTCCNTSADITNFHNNRWCSGRCSEHESSQGGSVLRKRNDLEND